MEEKGRPLTSPVYLSALALLMANDWLLKPLLHNELTGKLSDLAGLFAITWFGVALLPRYRWLVSGFLGVAFVYWKSPDSQALIDTWNNLTPFPVRRVVDPSDCVALATIPFAALCAPRARGRIRAPLSRVFVVALSLFAFTATSYGAEYDYDRSYSFSMSAAELRQRVTLVALSCREVSPIGILAPEELEIGVPDDGDMGWVFAIVRVDEAPIGSQLTLIKLKYGGPPEGLKKDRLLGLFETKIIERIAPDP